MFALVLITIFTMRKNYPDVGEADFALELQSLVRSVVRIEKKVKDFIEKVNQTDEYNTLLTRREAAEYLKISTRQFDRRVKDFHIWHVQKDNRVYFRKCDLVTSKQEVDSDWALNVLRGVIDINGKIKEPKPKAGRLIRR